MFDRVDSVFVQLTALRNILQNWFLSLEYLYNNNNDASLLRQYLAGNLTKLQLAEEFLSDRHVEERQGFWLNVTYMEQFLVQYRDKVEEVGFLFMFAIHMRCSLSFKTQLGQFLLFKRFANNVLLMDE